MKVPKFFNMVAKTELLNEILEQLKENFTKLEEAEKVEDELTRAGLCSYYLSKIATISKEWPEIWQSRAHFMEYPPFEANRVDGFEVRTAEKNCPYCSLTPLDVSTSTPFCPTCQKFVVYGQRAISGNPIERIVELDNNIIFAD